ncbi:MAG: DNA cytosine methyltransferase [Elusimicrobiota bacterium]
MDTDTTSMIESNTDMPLTVVEICAGAGGQAIGLEMAGFRMVAAIDNDQGACQTLRYNRPKWTVIQADLQEVNGLRFEGADLLAGGVPCPPFSIAGKQLGSKDGRDLFPQALRLAKEINPRAIMLENVRGFASNKFSPYRKQLQEKLARLGFESDWRVLNASDHGVPQLRPRFILVGFKHGAIKNFSWPDSQSNPPTVAETLEDLLASGGWKGIKTWKLKAATIAPTLVGGSKKHGGPDLGPTRARRQWANLGVDGLGIANDAPGKDFPTDKMPRITVGMAARLQGFPDRWKITGSKTAAYRQVGNAFPPPVAYAIGKAIHKALRLASSSNKTKGLMTA